MFFDVDCFNPETINKYCYMCVTSREATVTSTERDLHGFGIDYRFRLTCGRHQWRKHRFLNHMYFTNCIERNFHWTVSKRNRCTLACTALYSRLRIARN